VVTIRLADEIDVSRGDMICWPHNQPAIAQDIDAIVCWMTDQPLQARAKLGLKHTTRSVRALVKELQYRLDINTLHRDETADRLVLNEISRVRLRTNARASARRRVPPARNRTKGGFILIDEATNRTVGAGMIIEAI
jgi:bifunctional enzyme CysN/CysC